MDINTEIFNKAIAVLTEKLPQLEISAVLTGDRPLLIIMGKEFVCQVEPTLTVANLVHHDLHKLDNKIFVTVNANEKVLEIAQSEGINVIDCAGNYAIRYTHKNGLLYFMLGNKGEPPVADPRPNVYPIFKDKGLQVIFYFLMDRENISKPYREIQKATGVAIGTVKNIIDGMIYQRFAKLEGNKRFLLNIDKLLMVWGANYCQILRPKLLLLKMKFRNLNDTDWQNLDLPKGMQWSCEAAAALTDKFLTPGTFTIYAEVPAPTIMKTGMVVPDIHGDICIYEKFWKEEASGKCVPPALTYAELMDTGIGRCIEAAQKMKEHELEYLF